MKSSLKRKESGFQVEERPRVVFFYLTLIPLITQHVADKWRGETTL